MLKNIYEVFGEGMGDGEFLVWCSSLGMVADSDSL